MSNQNLPALITKAAQALASAKTAAQILDAGTQAKVAYDAAKLAARLNKAKQAHDEVVAACHRAMADALVIETQAQCRLADEYDAAQDRGEIQTQGGQNRKSEIPKKNFASDVGISGKQIHEARIIRDAEKKKPGVVQKAIDRQLQADKEPTRADVKRAIKVVLEPKNIMTAPLPPRSPKQDDLDERNAKIIALADDGWSAEQIAREFDVVTRVVHRILEVEKARRGSPSQAVAELSLTAQQKLDAAVRQARRKLEAEFELRLRKEVRRRLEDTVLPEYQRTYAEHQQIIKLRKGVMDKSTYRKILSCLHPDRVQALRDAGLTRRFADAFDLFTKLEKMLLDEKQSPTAFAGLPRTYEELMKARQEVMAKRRAQRDSKASVDKRY